MALQAIGVTTASIATYDNIINARGNGNGQNVLFRKTSFTTVANSWSGTFQAGGNSNNAIDIISFFWDGTNYFATYSQNFG